MPSGLNRITSDRVGYVQHIELSVLSELAEATDQDIYLECLPGSFVSAGGVLGVGGALTDAQQAKARAAFTIDITRTFAQDPRFGLIALGETADKALSPGINDPGTAIDVIGRFVRIFSVWKDDRPSPPLVHPRLHIRPLDPADMFDDAFRPIARDGAGLIEVQVRLQKAYLALAMAAPETLGPVAVQHAHESLARSLEHLTLPRERATVQQAFDEVRMVQLHQQARFAHERFDLGGLGGKLGAQLSSVDNLMHLGDALPLVTRDTEMSDALIEISQKGFGVVGVTDEAGLLAGIITDGDLRRHMDGLLALKARDVMTASPTTIAAGSLAQKAVGIMNARKITCLFVVPKEGPALPIGLIHIHDCLRVGLG